MDEAKPQSAEEFVRMLLWDDFPECCGSPVVGAEYMGQQEMVCCGCPEPALLSDAQIVAALRERFPESAAPLPQGVAQSADDPLDKMRRCSLGCAEYGQCKAAMHGVPSECPSPSSVQPLSSTTPLNSDGAKACPESGKHCRWVEGECQTCGLTTGAPPCPTCDGAGELESALHCEKCPDCKGTGNAAVSPSDVQPSAQSATKKDPE